MYVHSSVHMNRSSVRISATETRPANAECEMREYVLITSLWLIQGFIHSTTKCNLGICLWNNKNTKSSIQSQYTAAQCIINIVNALMCENPISQFNKVNFVSSMISNTHVSWRSQLNHIVCIGVAPPWVVKPQAQCLGRDQWKDIVLHCTHMYNCMLRVCMPDNLDSIW